MGRELGRVAGVRVRAYFVTHLLYFILVLGIQISPQADWDRSEPCGVWTDVCRTALMHHDLNPNHYAAPLDYQLTWLQAFGWVQWCESRHYPLAVGDQGHSRGLWQFSDIYRPDVLVAQAFDPWASTYQTAQDWADGNAAWWSCFRILRSRIT